MNDDTATDTSRLQTEIAKRALAYLSPLRIAASPMMPAEIREAARAAAEQE